MQETNKRCLKIVKMAYFGVKKWKKLVWREKSKWQKKNRIFIMCEATNCGNYGHLLPPFYTKIPWNQMIILYQDYTVAVFTKYFSSESNFLVFPYKRTVVCLSSFPSSIPILISFSRIMEEKNSLTLSLWTTSRTTA